MPEQDHGVLDARIRELVARAVDDAPAAPDLHAATTLEPRSPRPDRSTWWIGGGAAVLAAAAAVAIAFVLVDDTDDRISTPATTPTATTVPVPATTVPGVTVPVPSVPVSPTTPPTTELASSSTYRQQELVTAGPDGVTALDLANSRPRRLDQPARRALPVGDGRVLFELDATGQPGGFGMWNPDGTTTDPLAGADLVGPMTIHDIAIIDGAPVLLHDIDPAANPEPDATLYAAPITADGIDLTAPIDLGPVSGPEFGVTGLSLAANGLIVGEAWSDGISSLWVAALPGTPGAELAGEVTPVNLGLEQTYDPSSCDPCAAAFTVDGSGQRIAWIAAADLVVTQISTGEEQQRIPLGDAAAGVLDVDVERQTFVLSYGPLGDRPPVIALPDGTFTVLEGFTADIGPGLGPDSVSDAAETTDVSPDPSAETGLYVTAGPTGLAVRNGADLVRQIDLSAEIALLTPGGAVIFQPPRPSEDAEPGDPLIWQPDGTVATFLPALPVEQSYRLHDVAEIDGVPTVLYGVSTRPMDIDPAQFVEVLRAVRLNPAGWVDAEIDEINTWEAGWSRLSLSDQGLIVGEFSESVTESLYVNAVPGSPAEGTTMTAADLGVEPEYSECEACPGNFTISQDGATVAWTEGDLVVLHPDGPGEVRRWRMAALLERPANSIDLRTGTDGTAEVIVNAAEPSDPTESVRFVLGADGSVVGAPTGSRFASFGP